MSPRGATLHRGGLALSRLGVGSKRGVVNPARRTDKQQVHGILRPPPQSFFN